jgi:hypothetical protein
MGNTQAAATDAKGFWTPSRYRLAGAPAGIPSGTAIYLLTSNQADELIGVVEGMSGLRLSDGYFRFVYEKPILATAPEQT